MQVWLWVAVGALGLAVVVLLVRLLRLRRSADALAAGFAERLTLDTNTLIGIPSRDRHMRALAASINRELRALRAERRRFQQGDRELREAVTNVSHDLRTPLTALCGWLELLEREEQSPETARMLARIADRAEALRRLTDELFCYSVAAAETPEPAELVALGDVLEESLAAAWPLLTQRGIRPELAIPAVRIERLLDRSALARVYGNILSNAVKYSGGDLSVSLDAAGEACFTNLAPALTAVEVGRLFDRFYTVESGSGSTGLGLSIAKRLTERMGGSIAAELADGRLCLRVRFPAAPEA